MAWQRKMNTTREADVQLFWIRRRLLAASTFFTAVAVGVVNVLNFGEGALSQGFFWYEQVLAGGAVASAIGIVLYATPWKVPMTQWAYWVLGWSAMLTTTLLLFATGFEKETRWVLGTLLLSATTGGFTAHTIDGGKQSNAESFLFRVR